MLAHPAKLWLINTDLDTVNWVWDQNEPAATIAVTLVESQHHIIDPANPRGALDDGVENRLHVRRRAADDAEHLGRCRLMLQGLAQFCVALLDLLEQAHVLDGDHRLRSECLEQSDLLFRERLDLGATNDDDANRLVLRALEARQALYGCLVARCP